MISQDVKFQLPCLNKMCHKFACSVDVIYLKRQRILQRVFFFNSAYFCTGRQAFKDPHLPFEQLSYYSLALIYKKNEQ